MPTLPKILDIEEICESRLFRIESVHLRFSNDRDAHFERVQGWPHGSVMIAPMIDEKTVLLVREYAVGVEQYVIGFAKGAVHEGEDILAAANREMQEEVGYAARELRQIMEFYASPGYIAASMRFVVARDLYPSKLEGDEPEEIEVVPWPLDRVDELLQHPEFIEARSIAAILWMERKWRAE